MGARGGKLNAKATEALGKYNKTAKWFNSPSRLGPVMDKYFPKNQSTFRRWLWGYDLTPSQAYSAYSKAANNARTYNFFFAPPANQVLNKTTKVLTAPNNK